MTVRYSRKAAAELKAIWTWNARQYDATHADDYVAFLRREVAALTSNRGHGRPVPTRPEYSYVTLRRRLSGHGHVAVYSVKGSTLTLLRVFHTAQNWQQQVKGNGP